MRSETKASSGVGAERVGVVVMAGEGVEGGDFDLAVLQETLGGLLHLHGEGGGEGGVRVRGVFYKVSWS